MGSRRALTRKALTLSVERPLMIDEDLPIQG